MLERDAPYTFRSITLELFIRKVSERWAFRVKNRADFTYFHYIPFCDVFATNDKVQSKYAKLWLNSKQKLVNAAKLRDELAEIKRLQGKSTQPVNDFPPVESTGLFATMMDEIWPHWRHRVADAKIPLPLGRDAERKILESIQKRLDQTIVSGSRIPAVYGTKGEQKPKD